jgi:hypothetical protein
MWEQSERPSTPDASEWTRLDDAQHHVDRGEYLLAARELQAGDDLRVAADQARALSSALASVGLCGLLTGDDLLVCTPADAAAFEAEAGGAAQEGTSGVTERKPPARALPAEPLPAERSRRRTARR